ncbi:MAG: cell division protein FtsZ [Burkholderiaceae bacterium]
MSFQMLENELDGANIKVVGIGGAGGNAVNHMIDRGVQGVEFIAINTDKQALRRSLAAKTIQLGGQGLGAGARPDAGRASAEAAREEIRNVLGREHGVPDRRKHVGKGTGTGASPVVARVARGTRHPGRWRGLGPFEFEGKKKLQVAEAGIEQMVELVDSLIVVLNQNLFAVMDEDASLEDAFKRADDVLNNAVAGIAEIINVPGLVSNRFRRRADRHDRRRPRR